MIAKFPLTEEGKINAIEYAKSRRQHLFVEHYVIMCTRLGDMGYYVEDDVGIIRSAFESQIFP